MAERGATPKVSPLRRGFLGAIRHLFNPLHPDDYLELINPLWTTRELRGRVVEVQPQGSGAATVWIEPGYEWPGHLPGQYVRLGVVIDGVFHWRAYSLTSDPHPRDGLIGVTPKLVEGGTVSPYLVRGIRPGEIVRLGEIEGVFTLPDPLPEKMLFVSAGSGITPIMSMLRDLDHRDRMDDVVVIHSAHSEDEVMFAADLESMDSRHDGLQLTLRITGREGRIKAADLDELCPDWRERQAMCSGPRDLLDSLVDHFESEGVGDRIHLERFQPIIGGNPGEGEGGTVRFLRSKTEVDCEPGTPILVAGEESGLQLKFGCRIGICHTCTGVLKQGNIRDLRTGEVSSPEGQSIRICVNTAEGDIDVDL
ncbi:Stearoyl-CoA 9-desaturase electron transfer partner [Gordonia paraffinivorans]|uniref:Stearoyl-CoA 9-desaturase electron transfer partner n=1 Tax=Gordonia paraffinivorans TaxID=175628 RepID=A0ABD7V3H1_9ACTN|nr:ferredoxin reductase [Gordonia paraffinivorans]VFA88864.1 Stearoyl-CoA 9-desaturase electron transfer partner [Gordonia paraffinivorans]